MVASVVRGIRDAAMKWGRYELLTQIGAGRDGVSYRGRSDDSPEPLELQDLGAARDDPQRWAWLLPRLRIAATHRHPAAIAILDLALGPRSALPRARNRGERAPWPG